MRLGKWFGARVGRPATGAVVALSLLVGWACFSLVEHWQRQAHERRAELAAHDMASNLRARLATKVEALHAVSAFLETPRREGVSLEQFRAFARPLLQRHPEIVALEWLPMISGDQRQRLEQWLAREQPGFELREPTRAGDMVRAVDRPVHVPLVYAEPHAGPVAGLDMAFDAARMAPVRRALETGNSTLSERFQLVEDPANVFSVATYARVSNAQWIPTEHSSEPTEFGLGVAVSLFRLNQLFEGALSDWFAPGMGLSLYDSDAPSELQFLWQWGQPAQHALQHEAKVPFVERTYRLVVLSPPAPITLSAWLALIGGALVTAVVGALLIARARNRSLERTVARLGQYHIEARLASGGMGSVYRARHALLRRPTAIKVAHPDQVASRLEKEVLLTSTLTHPNTVSIYDFGRSEDGTFYYAMEYIEGFDLQRLVDEHGALPVGRVLRILVQVCGSLHEAHQRGIVHRDVKPSNVMLTERGGMVDFVKVLDFGLARYAEVEPSSAASRSVAFAGTPGYAAPEIIAGSSATPRSDVFSFGCLAYFLLQGRPPFGHATPAQALTAVLTQDPEPLDGSLPVELSRLLYECMSKSPEQRPSSLLLISERLKQIAQRCPAWTQADAEAWWRANPVSEGQETAHQSASLFIDIRRLRSTLPSDTSQLTGAVGRTREGARSGH